MPLLRAATCLQVQRITVFRRKSVHSMVTFWRSSITSILKIKSVFRSLKEKSSNQVLNFYEASMHERVQTKTETTPQTLRLSWQSIICSVFGEKEVTWQTLNKFSMCRIGRILDNVRPVMLCLSVYLSVCLSVCVCCLSVYMSVCLSVLSVSILSKTVVCPHIYCNCTPSGFLNTKRPVLLILCTAGLNIHNFTFSPQTVVTWFLKQPLYPNKTVPHLFFSQKHTVLSMRYGLNFPTYCTSGVL
jgi:hypothetical protein